MQWNIRVHDKNDFNKLQISNIEKMIFMVYIIPFWKVSFIESNEKSNIRKG